MLRFGRGWIQDFLQWRNYRLKERLNLAPVCAPARWNGNLSLPAPLGWAVSYRQKEDAMVRDPWIVAAALFAFGVIG